MLVRVRPLLVSCDSFALTCGPQSALRSALCKNCTDHRQFGTRQSARQYVRNSSIICCETNNYPKATLNIVLELLDCTLVVA